MNIRLYIVIMVSAGLIGLLGCEVSDPGTSLVNQPPTTNLTVAPLEGDTVNHVVALRWAGNDPDGEISGFYISLDGGPAFLTAATDTVIAYSAPDESAPLAHSFSVQAVDDDDARDGSPPTRSFYTFNFAPVASWGAGSVPNNATVGHGFQMVLSASDSNDAGVEFSLSLNDTLHWSEWSRDSIMLIADLNLEYTTVMGQQIRLFPDGSVGVSNEGLTSGTHAIYGRVRDAGGALSNIVSRNVIVEDGRRPVMSPTVTGTYGSQAFYRDGSVFRLNNTTTDISYEASAAAYRGQINAYQYYTEAGGWSEWLPDASIELVDLPEGEYPFQFTARDLAGANADTIDFTIRIVRTQFSDSIIVVDETRDGNGNPGSPNDEVVDEFYRALVEGLKYREIDYGGREGGIPYLSPFDLQHAGLVIWHADDRAEKRLGDNTCANCILTQYLNLGGRLILSGWDLVGALVTTDSADFNSGSFGYNQLRTFEAWQNTGREAFGMDGVNGFPSLRFDGTKLPASWESSVDRCWVFAPRGECRIIGNFAVNNPGENPYEGRAVGYVYDQSFRIAVFGIPLYFTNLAETQAVMDVLLPQMMSGLHP